MESAKEGNNQSICQHSGENQTINKKAIKEIRTDAHKQFLLNHQQTTITPLHVMEKHLSHCQNHLFAHALTDAQMELWGTEQRKGKKAVGVSCSQRVGDIYSVNLVAFIDVREKRQ